MQLGCKEGVSFQDRSVTSLPACCFSLLVWCQEATYFEESQGIVTVQIYVVRVLNSVEIFGNEVIGMVIFK